ncbi:sulfatase family protein [Alicyclobacillus kakegawensis]|uniref:sulfatase family protein n=1 Tax=Alicyclobacillus kakegawensis TaxID=392012 RepID=UPI0009FB02F6|nr:sulfatase-like hydrolase/transferase [Alicyclobacillus kakegawensis]
MEVAQVRPNVLLITTDQQHANTIHALGNSVIKTPNLDALAARGVSFGRTYVTNPVCSPSRASILTGEYPSRHGCWNIGVKLDEGRPRISDAFSAAGYRTALFGKTHFQPVLAEGSFEARPHTFDRDFWRHWDGPYYGFQKVKMLHGHADEISSAGMHYGVWLEDQGIDIDKYFGPNGGYREGRWDLPEEFHYTRWTADQTIEFLEQHDTDQPFFVWCSFQDPHNAFLVPEPWDQMYDIEDLPEFIRRPGEMDDKTLLHKCLIEDRLDEMDVEITADPNHPTKGIQCLGPTTDKIGETRAKRWLAAYYGMISLIDHHIGRLMQTLDRLGLTENTVVIFTSDHGDYAGNHGLWLKGPLHYEDVIRVPFIVSWPGHIPQNVQSQSLQSLVDLAPTLCDLCQIGNAPSVQGVSQLHTWMNPHESVRNYCLIENRAEPAFYVKTIVDERYKLNYFLGRNEGELYDLQEDPHEFVNLYNDPAYTDVVLRMMKAMIDMYGQLEGPYPPRLSFA